MNHEENEKKIIQDLVKIDDINHYNFCIFLNKVYGGDERLPEFLSLKSILTNNVASFFTSKTTHHIDILEIPESLKEDVKRCVC